MQVETSLFQVAGLGALIAVAVVLFLAVVIGLVVATWAARRAALFRSFGIERNESGSVQFKGLFDTQKERAEEATLIDKVFGPGDFGPRDEDLPEQPKQPN